MSVKLDFTIALFVLGAITLGSAENMVDVSQNKNPLDSMGFSFDIAGLFAPAGSAIGKFIDGVTTGMDAGKGDWIQVIDDFLMMIPGVPKIIKPGDDYFNPLIPKPGVKPGVA
jgi:hypothetical protein